MVKTNLLLTSTIVVLLAAGIAYNVYDNNYKRVDSISLNIGVQDVNIGSYAPEINMTSPAGKNLKLSSLKGKYVLVDFWASWCGPCRKENPYVVEVYQKYSKAKFKNAKGFEIFSVSLDNNKQAWEKAIDQDGLSWKYHVSDLKGWQSEAAKTYQVTSIPANFLLNPEGVIVAKNLRGINMHLELDKYITGFK
jgi:thiol-disulfide isomerase/thioredoxin